MSQIHDTILGVRIDSTQPKEVIRIAWKKVAENSKFFIVTPNPEIILASTKDASLKDALNSADLALCDGIGLTIASRILYNKSINRVTGRQMFVEFLKLADKRGLKVFLLGSTDIVIQKTLHKIQKSYPNIKILGKSGPTLDTNASPLSKTGSNLQADVIEKINKFKPDLLFVAFGAPKQEKWVANNKSKLNIKVVMVVGGAFDSYSGAVKSVPSSVANLGFEWLWRLIQEPKRIWRIFNAVVIFPLLVLQEKFK